MTSQAFSNATVTSYRNRIINPDSYIDQRNAGALVTTSGYTVDRYVVSQSSAGVLSSQQDTTTALGANQPTISSHKINVATQHATLAAGDLFLRSQYIEASRMRDSFWGTSNAKTFVYTVGVYVPVAGVYSVSFQNYAQTRSYVSAITVNNANTLEFHTVVVPGDTGGTWATTANAGFLNISFDLGSGSTYTTSTLNTWQTGNFTKATSSLSFCTNATATSMHIAWEQFENGYATAPELIHYDDVLRQCQRYYEQSYDIGVVPGTTTSSSQYSTYTSGPSGFNGGEILITFKINKRTAPTNTYYSPASGASGKIRDAVNAVDITATGNSNGTTTTSVTGVMGTANNYVNMQCHWVASAEL